MQRKSLWLFLVMCVPLIWFVSGISRKNGLFVFLVGSIGISLCVFIATRGRLKPLFVSFLFLILSAATVALVEAALWLKPNILPGNTALHVYGAYHAELGGIYQLDRHLGYAFKPNFDQRIYWSGYWWRHQTNEHGYRGEAVSRPDAVFLGDSMIYGHGVENHETVASCFARRTGLRTANLGQQGTCLVQMATRLEEIGRDWRPKYIFVCGHFNDIPEVALWYPSSEMKRYIQGSPSDSFQPSAHRNFWPRPAWRLRHYWNKHCALPLRFGGVLQFLVGRLQENRGQSETNNLSAFVESGLPVQAFIESPFTPWSGEESQQIGWSANVHALKRIHHYCVPRGTQMIVFDLGYPRAFSEAIQKAARELGVGYIPVGRVALERGLAGESVYLPNDGHWSPNGNDLVAEQITNYLP